MNASKDCDPNLPPVQSKVYSCLHGLSGLLAVGGNFVVLLVITRTASLRTVSHLFIASLAAADLSVGLTLNPIYVVMVTERLWVSGHILYRLENFLWIQTLVASTFNLCAISVDRYFAITAVFRYHDIMTRHRCLVIVGFTWFTSFGFASSSLFIQTADQASILWVTCLIVTVLFPLGVICYCYFFIFKEARAQVRRIYINTTQANQRKDMIKNQKAAWTVGIIILLFVLLFSPNFGFSIAEFVTRDACAKQLVYRHWLWAILIVFSSSACNPFVYAIRMREFKVAIKRTFRIPLFTVSSSPGLARALRKRAYTSSPGTVQQNTVHEYCLCYNGTQVCDDDHACH